MTAAGATAGDTSFKNVRVCIRCRPFIPQENKKGHTGELLSVATEHSTISLRNTRNAEQHTEKRFTYDCVFDQETTQEQVFETSGAKSMCAKVAEGFHATVFACAHSRHPRRCVHTPAPLTLSPAVPQTARPAPARRSRWRATWRPTPASTCAR